MKDIYGSSDALDFTLIIEPQSLAPN